MWTRTSILPIPGNNQFRNFDFTADTAHVNMAKVTIDHAPGIAGAMRYGFAKKFAVAARAEWFDDFDGFSTARRNPCMRSR